MEITHEINQRLGLSLTDAFCGFKAYSRKALKSLPVTETGYAMPLEVWVLAAAAKNSRLSKYRFRWSIWISREVLVVRSMTEQLELPIIVRFLNEQSVRYSARSGVDRGVGYGVGSPAMRVDA